MGWKGICTDRLTDVPQTDRQKKKLFLYIPETWLEGGLLKIAFQIMDQP